MLNDAEPSKDNCSSNTVPANSQEMKSKKKQGVTVLVNVSGSKRALFYHCTPCLHYEAWKATKSHSATDAPWMPWTLYLSGLKTILDILSFLSSSFLEQKHLLEPCNLSQRAKRQEMCRAPRRSLLGLVLLLPKTRAIIINVWAEDHCVRITGETHIKCKPDAIPDLLNDSCWGTQPQSFKKPCRWLLCTSQI